MTTSVRLPAGVAIILLVAVSAMTAGCAGGSASVHHERTPPTLDTGIWAGELLKNGGGFASVDARWMVPSVTCESEESGVAYSWVGLGGWDADQALEQVGTAEGCAKGTPYYRLFWEFFPAPPNFGDDLAHQLDPYPMVAGDSIYASVAQLVGGTYQLTVRDETQGWTFSRSGRSPAYALHRSGTSLTGPGNTTAEVVQEAVSSNSVDLPDYRSLDFTQVKASPVGSNATQRYRLRTSVGDVSIQDADVQGDHVFVVWRRRS